MYKKMLDFWLGEMDAKDLQKPPRGFKEEAGKYLQQLGTVDGDLAKVKAAEGERFRFMLEDLTRLRREKICRAISEGRSVEGLLLEDELEMGMEAGATQSTGTKVGAEAGAGIVTGTGLASPVQVPKSDAKAAADGSGEGTTRKMLIRMLRDVPPLVGADLKTYGPYNKEDVVLLPAPNAEALIKREMAVEVTRRA